MPENVRPAPAGSPTIGDIYYLLFRHKWTILFCSLLGLLASGAVYWLTPAVYESEAALLVRYVSDSTILEEVTIGDRITAPGRGGENVINSEIAILSSRDLIEKVMDKMGISRFTDESTNRFDRARIAADIQAALRIDAPKNSNIIRIAFGGATPAVAQEFLQQLTEAYLQKHMFIHRDAGTYDVLSRQTDQLRARLNETEEELGKIKAAEGIVSLDSTRNGLAQRIDELTKQLDEMDAALVASKARTEVLLSVQLQANAGVTSAASTKLELKDAPSSEFKAQLAALQKQEADLLASGYTPDSIPVSSVRTRIAQVQRLQRGASAALPAGSVNLDAFNEATQTAFLSEQANMAALQAKVEFQKGLLNREIETAKKIQAVESKIVQLQRSREIQEANYKYFCQSLERAKIDEALNAGRISNINVVQPATLPAKRTRLDLRRNMGLALLLGLALGLGLAVLKEFFLDNTIRRAGELAGLFGVSLVMTLPFVSRHRPGTQRGKAGPPGGEEHGDNAICPVLADFCDSFWVRLSTAIDATRVAKPYILGVTSCAPGSGVSTLADGLAQALAKDLGETVVLVDARAESGCVAGYEVTPGGDFVGLHPPADAAAGGHPGLQAMVGRLKVAGVRFVIVDLPPVTETGMTLRAARLLNGMVLVVPSERITRSVAGHVRGWLVQSNVKIVGCILNMRRKYVPEWLCQKL